MAGAGFEPAKAVPCGLQPHPFDRSGTPPGRVESSVGSRPIGRTTAPYDASRSRCASGSASSFFSVWFSIWRIRSRVTLKARPTSSSV